MALPGSQNPAFTLLPNLLLVLAVATGIIITEPNLPNDRKLGRAAGAAEQGKTISRDSYYWEDPFKDITHVIPITPPGPAPDQKHVGSGGPAPVPATPAGAASSQGKKLPSGELNLTIPGEKPAVPAPDPCPPLGSVISDEGASKVVFVGLEGSSNPADIERRIRTRLAVSQALCARAGMIRCTDTGLSEAYLKSADGTKAHGVAVECFRSLDRKTSPGKVAVVYVNESTMVPRPCTIGHAMKEVTGCNKDPKTIPRFAYIGLCRSDQFVSFLEAAHGNQPQEEGWDKPAIRIYSPHATVDDRLVEPVWRENRLGTRAKNSSFLGPDYRFKIEGGYGVLHRVGAHDGELAEALVAELKIRGIKPPEESSAGNPKDAILLLADMDRFHSRMLVRTFAEKWDKKERGKELSPAFVRVIHYPEALDALGMSQSPASNAQGGGGSSSGKATAQGTSGSAARGNPGGIHAAEGFIQFDSLSRLPARIRELEREDGVRYRAIGLFGSDVHDKLQILRALKPGFPQALFFTNDLDARLWQGENRGDSINLVVAGAFGLSMDGEIQGSVAPFRSSYQTATYLACLHAIGYSPKPRKKSQWLEKGLSPPVKDAEGAGNRDKPRGVRREVEIHEVGRTGDQLLAFHMSHPGGKEAVTKPHAPGRPLSVQREGQAEKAAHRFFRIVVCLLFLVILFHVWPPVLRRCCGTEPLAPAEFKSMDKWDRAIRSKLPRFLFPGKTDITSGKDEGKGRKVAEVQEAQAAAGMTEDKLESTGPAPISLNSSLVAAALTVAVAALCWLASGMGTNFGQPDGTNEGGTIFAGVSAKPVVAANYLITAIGLMMVYLLLRPQFNTYPYPFRALPPEDVAPLPPLPGSRKPPMADEPAKQDSGPDRGLENFKDLPPLRDVGGWLSGIYRYLRQRERPHLPDGCAGWFREMLQSISDAQHERKERCVDWLKPDSPQIARAFARERLVNLNGSVLCRVGIYLLVGLVVNHLLYKGEPVLGAPSSIRGETLREAFERGDLAVKIILTVVAAIALDRQLMLAAGLEKLRRFLKERTLEEADDADLQPPYPWHHRPEVVDITKEDAEKTFGVGKGSEFSGHEGFWELPLLRTAAARFREVAPCMVMPFILAFLILVTRHPVFENIPFPTSELVLFGFILLGPLAIGMLAQHCMARVFTATQERLRRGQRFVAKTTGNERKAFLDGEVKAAEELEGRTRFGFFGNPLVEAILLPLGGYGVLEFSGILASFLK